MNIIPGLKCTMTCDHCVNDSSPFRDNKVTADEITNIITALNKLQPREIVFTGGEPTLYIDQCNQILNNLIFEYKVILTTNGSFAVNPVRTQKVLDNFLRLNTVQLSFDKFHNGARNTSSPYLIREYCKRKNLDFVIIVSLSSPEEIIFVNNLKKEYKCNVVFQKIEGSGRARETHTEFEHPIFDETVLKEKCPNRNTFTYISHVGFSPCCSNLVFNSNLAPYADFDINRLQKSEAYREIVNMSFEDRLKKYKISRRNLLARHSSPCNLCEFIEMNKSSYEV